MAKSSLCLLVVLLLCCELARGNHEYPSTFEERLNTLENELESTKAKLVKTEHRLGETELKNKQLEMKLQISIETFDSKYKELYDTIENTQTTLKVANEKLKATDVELGVTQEELKTTTTKLYTTFANLKSYCNNLDSTDSKLHQLDPKEEDSKFVSVIDILKSYYIKRNDTRSNLGQLTASKESSGQRLATDNKETNSKVKRVDELGSVIAFHAELGPHKTNLVANATIKFETVTQNVGNAYDPRFGFFTCTQSGLYFFTFTIMANRGEELETKLVVNDSPIAYSYSAGPPGLFNSGSKSVITHLHPGDRVWIEANRYNDNRVFGDTWSTFTGFMIKET